MNTVDLYSDAGLNDDERSLLNAELHDDEHLLWVGRPAPNPYTLRRLLPIPGALLMAVLWGVLLWFASPYMEEEASSDFALMQIPFYLAILLTPLTGFSGLWEVRQLRRSIYAVTNGRSIALEKTLFGYRHRSWPANEYLYVKHRKHGSGDIIYEEETRRDQNSVTTIPRGLMELPDVERMVALLQGNENTDLARRAIKAAEEAAPTLPAENRRAQVVSFLMIPIGLLIFALGAYKALCTRHIQEHYLPTEGVIVAVETETTHGTKRGTVTSYRPVFAYTVNGKSYQAAGPVSASEYEDCLTGGSMELLYNPENPEEICPNDYTSLWSIPAMCTGFGGAFMLIGSLIFYRTRKQHGKRIC